jgi:hypothetical protein
MIGSASTPPPGYYGPGPYAGPPPGPYYAGPPPGPYAGPPPGPGHCAQWGYDYNGNRVCTGYY